jgi:hypothetical protein
MPYAYGWEPNDPIDPVVSIETCRKLDCDFPPAANRRLCSKRGFPLEGYCEMS